jgi:hypothetical protein
MDAKMKHSITIDGKHFRINRKQWEQLIGSDFAYECGEDHDLHLIPDREWRLDNIEDLLKIVLSHQEFE